MREKPSQGEEMSSLSDVTEMRAHVRLITALAPEDSRKSALRFAAMVLRLPFYRVKKLYYGEARRVDAHEADRIRAYVDQAQDLIQKRAEYEAERARFIAEAHPALARLAPPALNDKRAAKRGRA